MSVWYQYDLHAIAANRQTVANFFHIPVENVYSDSFKLSFGGKNGACLPLDELMEKHPDIIWLVKQHIECETSNYWIERYDNVVGEHQRIPVEFFNFSSHNINDQLMREYDQAFPGLVAKHMAGEQGYETFRWSMFLNDFGIMAAKLRHAADYEKMVTLITNDDFVDNDYSHLELEDD